MTKVITNPEFGIELVLAIPYAYWLHQNNQLEYVVTSRGMKPFYYFCDDVREEFSERTIDNAAAGLNELSNNWLHHNSVKVFGIDYSDLNDEDKRKANGVLDYSQWTPPPYKEYYKNDEIGFGKPIVFISNKYNLEFNQEPFGYFDIKCLYEMFSYLTENGYAVVYKRVTNEEEDFTLDQNEVNSIRAGYHNILANVEGIGTISDRQLPEYFEDVYLFDDIVEKYSYYSYNEVQLKVMANSEGLISVCGGNSMLSAYFGNNVISYVHRGAELRPDYYGENTYYSKLLGTNNVIPIYDVISKVNDVEVAEKWGYKVNYDNKNDYTEILNKMKEVF
jgi:hypothetical protein